MECAFRDGDWSVYVYQALDCAELEQLAGRREQAILYYERLLALEEGVYLKPGMRADAVMQARQLVATVKPEVYLRIGEYHLDSGRSDQAEIYLRKSAQLKPGIWDTEFALGKCWLAQKRPAEAERAFCEAIRLVAEDAPEMVPELEGWRARCR